MADKIKINTGSLNSDAENISTNIKNMKTALKNLKASLAKLDSMWDGPSSESFKKAFNNDVTALQNVIDNLSNLNTYEKNAKTKYDNCEKQVGNLVSSIRV
jgi:WXG100 family type VII secretion target